MVGPDGTAAELAAVRATLGERDAKIATLEGTIATNVQTQSALQTAQQESAKSREERDADKQQIGSLEAKVTQIEAALKEAQATSTQRQQEIRTLSNCLNGTAVALAFGKTGRWSSAELAITAVESACKASEPLLQR